MHLRTMLLVGMLGLPTRAAGPDGPVTTPRQAVRVYLLHSFGLIGSFASTGEASYREYTGCVTCGPSGPFNTGVGLRTTPPFAYPLLLDLELGAVILERVRVAVEVVPPDFQFLGHVGVDLPRMPFTRPGNFGTFTLWLGGGYEHLWLFSGNPELYGLVASTRVTLELKWGLFIVRPEVLARLQFVDQFNEENEGEGKYRHFASPVANFQLGSKLGVGITFPR
jgi:hypothetical protein